MNADVHCARVHAVYGDNKVGPWIEVIIAEPEHRSDGDCVGTMRLHFDGVADLAGFMASLNEALDRFIRNEQNCPIEAGVTKLQMARKRVLRAAEAWDLEAGKSETGEGGYNPDLVVGMAERLSEELGRLRALLKAKEPQDSPLAGDPGPQKYRG